MSDFQRWEAELGFSLNGLVGGCRGNLCSCSAPDSQLCTWMDTLLLGSFFWRMKQINWERIPGNSLCALYLLSFFSETPWKKRNLEAWNGWGKSFRIGRAGQHSLWTALQKNCTQISYQLHGVLPKMECKCTTIILLKSNGSFEDKNFVLFCLITAL